MIVTVLLLFCSTVCYGQTTSDSHSTDAALASNPLTEKIGNFSIELLYHTSSLQTPRVNLIMSPITIWTALAAISEGATGNTKLEIRNALRLPRNKTVVRMHYSEVARWLKVSKTDIIELEKFNGIFIDKSILPLADFREDAKTYYETNVVTLLFNDTRLAASLLNRVISNITHGRIPLTLRSYDFIETPMILSSALFFKGKWTIPFNTTSTRKQPFYDSDRNQIGEVNMMYNRASYNFAEIKILQARVVELPIGNENRLSMVIMLPNYGVSLENMFSNFARLSLDQFFKEFKPLIDDFSRNKVELYLPRFKIESNLDLTIVLDRMGVRDMFQPSRARLPLMARRPNFFASSLLHVAGIEITEEGIPQEDSDEEFSNRVGVAWFEVNRPFTYMIVEKISNTIIFGGFYLKPSLY